jgi:hypothetical protein
MKKIYLTITETVVKAVRSGRIIEGRLMLVKSGDGHEYIEFRPYNRKPKTRRPDEMVKKLRSGWIKLSAMRLKVFASSSNALSAQEVVNDLKGQINEGLDAILRDERVSVLKSFYK